MSAVVRPPRRDATLPEFPPKRLTIVLTLVTTAALVACVLLVRVPQVAELTLVGVRADELRVAGLNVPELEDGDRVTIWVGETEVSGTASGLEAIPESEAHAFLLDLDENLVDVPVQYSTARADFGATSVLDALVGQW
ncbi:hypothetical protein [Georgenia wangjunii]|uniref:hypothetical protein n=1 Tax=Georgenia wangjunii TaxID=3117730 RepID=UPI002F263567